MWTSSPFLNNAIQGDDGGKGNINSRAELVASLSTPAKTVEMSLIFEGILDAFKLKRFQENYKHSSLRVCTDNPKCHQRHQPHSGT